MLGGGHLTKCEVLYAKLVALGEPVVAPILAELERESSVSWITVLAAITGENPAPPELAGRVDAMGLGSIGGDNGGMRCERRTRGSLPFPGLATDVSVVASPKTHAYNCVAWAAEDASR